MTRLASTIFDTGDVVMETGLYNVNEKQSSTLNQTQEGTWKSWLFVKMPDPQVKQAGQPNDIRAAQIATLIQPLQKGKPA